MGSGTGSVWGPVLAALVGGSFVLLGIFPINPALGYPPGGLLQRVAIISGFGWMAFLALWLVRRKQPAMASHVENVATYER
ncbi:MAG: hypothetical protein ACXWQR_03085 [Ktedonobacterales bacterium]